MRTEVKMFMKHMQLFFGRDEEQVSKGQENKIQGIEGGENYLVLLAMEWMFCVDISARWC